MNKQRKLREMTNEEIAIMFGCQDWHAKPSRFKHKIRGKYKKQLKKSDNFDFYCDGEEHIYIRGMLSDKDNFILLEDYKFKRSAC